MRGNPVVAVCKEATREGGRLRNSRRCGFMEYRDWLHSLWIVSGGIERNLSDSPGNVFLAVGFQSTFSQGICSDGLDCFVGPIDPCSRLHFSDRVGRSPNGVGASPA